MSVQIRPEWLFTLGRNMQSNLTQVFNQFERAHAPSIARSEGGTLYLVCHGKKQSNQQTIYFALYEENLAGNRQKNNCN